MPSSPHVNVRVDLLRVRENARALRTEVRVPLLAVVKADAYGLGAAQVIPAIDDQVDGYCFFSFAEAAAAQLRILSAKPAITLGPPDVDPVLFRQNRVRPAVSSAREAKMLRTADPVLSVDTGMQRFACPPDEVETALYEGGCREAMTHATSAAQVRRLKELAGGRKGVRLHAAGSSLLHDPSARLDAVRPGLALYAGATRVSTRLVEVRDQRGPAGYTGFTSPTGRHGVVLFGYAHGLRRGPCLVNGRPSNVLEVGMQSAFVEVPPNGREGHEVVLLGDGITEEAVADAWGAAPHVVLVTLTGAGVREHE